MEREKPTLWELKQAAKWARELEERRRAIEQMARTYQKEAIHALDEVRNTAVHDEIRRACLDAIRKVGIENNTLAKGDVQEKQEGRKVSKIGNSVASKKRKGG